MTWECSAFGCSHWARESCSPSGCISCHPGVMTSVIWWVRQVEHSLAGSPHASADPLKRLLPAHTSPILPAQGDPGRVFSQVCWAAATCSRAWALGAERRAGEDIGRLFWDVVTASRAATGRDFSTAETPRHSPGHLPRATPAPPIPRTWTGELRHPPIALARSWVPESPGQLTWTLGFPGDRKEELGRAEAVSHAAMRPSFKKTSFKPHLHGRFVIPPQHNGACVHSTVT
ncbi:hypothetical protein SAMN00790413_04293 [Deinococcus hopiensis KR-140]|uniref:Uncharacterized protein n=1 Tax=Deinococcus hopiensis KR-140 TaxID=695939 RepID=A0A1W1UPW0_9DEIO|nr:hypothetical protein SAMN00790413_04293 [Deinococcus hopiensis KR-140]